MDMTLCEINKIIIDYFPSNEEEPIICNVAIPHMALRILEDEIERVADEYDKLLPKDIKDRLAQIHYHIALLKDMIK
jgi:hypothetical protein